MLYLVEAHAPNQMPVVSHDSADLHAVCFKRFCDINHSFLAYHAEHKVFKNNIPPEEAYIEHLRRRE